MGKPSFPFPCNDSFGIPGNLFTLYLFLSFCQSLFLLLFSPSLSLSSHCINQPFPSCATIPYAERFWVNALASAINSSFECLKCWVGAHSVTCAKEMTTRRRECRGVHSATAIIDGVTAPRRHRAKRLCSLVFFRSAALFDEQYHVACTIANIRHCSSLTFDTDSLETSRFFFKYMKYIGRYKYLK